LQLREKAGNTQPVLLVALAAAQGTGGGTNAWLVVGVALIAATAALLGAMIAAWTAGTRQKEQLASENQRQTEALVAERERLDKQLASEKQRQAEALVAERERLDKQLAAENERHRETLALERETRELEELRKVVDGAAGALTGATEKVIEAFKVWSALSPDSGPDERAAVGTRNDEARHAVVAADMSWYRVTLRLGAEHPLARTMHDIVTALTDLGMLIDRSPSDDQSERIKEIEDARFSALREFRKTAVEVVGSRLEPRRARGVGSPAPTRNDQ
jgi:hypothetical protein